MSTLSSLIDTTNKIKFLKENIEDLRNKTTYNKRQRNSTHRAEKSALTFSISNSLKNKKIIKLVNNQRFIGVEEGLIELPKIKPSLDKWRKLTPAEQELKQLEEIPNLIKLQITSSQDENWNLEDGEEANYYDNIKTAENEIKKLNGWDILNAVDENSKYHNRKRTTNNFNKITNALDSVSMKWFMDIKSNPKGVALLERNSYLREFFQKIDEEQKAIFTQSLNINKKQFNFNVFGKGGNEVTEDTLTRPKGSSIDFYREVMQNKIKVEEFMRADLGSVADSLHSSKKKKKKIMEEMVNLINDLNNIDNKRKEVLENARRSTRPSIIAPKQKEFQRFKKMNSLNQADILFADKKMKIEQSNEISQKIKAFNRSKKEIELKIEVYNHDLDIIEDEIRLLKIRLNDRINDHRKYYFEILKKGIDVRRDGLSWVIARLTELKTYIEYSKFPKFLTSDQIEYMLLVAYKQHELSELIQLFRVLKKKQKEMRESHLQERNSNSNHKLTETTTHYQKTLKDEDDADAEEKELFVNSHYGICLNDIYAKYEHIINICLNETNEDQYIKTIARELHEKIVQSYMNENSNDENEALYFLPGSLAEFFNESNKFRQYFDDIIYLNTQISKKESELKEIKKEQMTKFKKASEIRALRNSIDHEMTFAAMFGNGINV